MKLPRFADLPGVRQRLVEADNWHTPDLEVGAMLLAVHNATILMGTFRDGPLKNPATGAPYEPALMDLTLSEWQFEQARREALAVLDYLIEPMVE